MKRKNSKMFQCHRIFYGYIDYSSEESEQIQTTTENVAKEDDSANKGEEVEIKGMTFIIAFYFQKKQMRETLYRILMKTRTQLWRRMIKWKKRMKR